MRRTESRFTSADVQAVALQMGEAVRAARIARNSTLEAVAQRARMSPVTWMRIERGEVSVATGSWLAALQETGLLERVAAVFAPQPAPPPARKRARRSNADDFDF
jgi:transcriptional regulator with XRE-family HTH domain